MLVLKDLDNVANAVAMRFGLFYSVNMSYPSQLRYTFEVIQKVVMGLDATQLSRKAQNFKTKLLMSAKFTVAVHARCLALSLVLLHFGRSISKINDCCVLCNCRVNRALFVFFFSFLLSVQVF